MIISSLALAITLSAVCLPAFAAEPVQVRSVRVVAGPDVAHLVPGSPLVIEEWQYHDLGDEQPVVRDPYGKISVGSSPVTAVYDLAAVSNRWINGVGTNYFRVAPMDAGTVSRFGLVSCASPPTVEVWSPARKAWLATVATNGALSVGAPYPLPYGSMRAVGAVDDCGALDVDVRRLSLYGGADMSATSGCARVRITWTPVGMPGTEAYAPLPLPADPASNAIIAVTADLDGNGRYSPGEPYGVLSAKPSPYFLPAVTLTGVSPATWRIDLSGAIRANSFAAQKSLIDRGILGYLQDNRESPTIDDMPDTRNFSMALCGVAINGIASSTVTTTRYFAFRKLISTARRVIDAGLWTEANLYEMGLYDVGEDYVTDGDLLYNLSVGNVTNATYNLLFNNRTAIITLTNNVLATSYVNFYDEPRPQCVQLTPDGTAFRPGTYPVFTWTCPSRKEYNRCAIIIYSSSGDDGNRLYTMTGQPERSYDGVYSMAIPIGIGWRSRSGEPFAAGINYWWTVSMIDAKFQTGDTTASRRMFYFAAD